MLAAEIGVVSPHMRHEANDGPGKQTPESKGPVLYLAPGRGIWVRVAHPPEEQSPEAGVENETCEVAPPCGRRSTPLTEFLFDAHFSTSSALFIIKFLKNQGYDASCFRCPI